LVLGGSAALSGDSPFAWVGCGLAALMIGGARKPRLALGAGGAAAIAFGIAVTDANLLGTVSGALFLGGVSSEMMLGHWYLVDPRLPRWALRRLAVSAGVGAVFDFGVLIGLGVFPWHAGDSAVGIGFIVLVVTTVALMAAVLGALGEDGYAGVMSATGLSYLALLTAFGSAVVGRLLVAGPVLS